MTSEELDVDTLTDLADLDLFSTEHLLDPYPAHRRLRDAGGMVWNERHQCWIACRYDAVRELLADYETFTNERGIGLNDEVNQALQGLLITSGPPLHETLRGVLAEKLSPRALRSLNGSIVAQARDLIEPLVAKGSFDAVNDLARVFPPTIVAELVGLPQEIRPKLLEWAEVQFQMLGPAEEPRTFAGMALVVEQLEWLAGVDGNTLTEGSWGRAIYEAADRGVIDQETAPRMLSTYVNAAMDTTVNALGTAVWLFSLHPDQWAAVRADRSLLPGAFNEIVRHDSPVQLLMRHATRDATIAGAEIKNGQRVMALYASANRDERHFGDDADEFRITRDDAAEHLAFGHGLHGCVGQGLARMETLAVLNVLADRVVRFEAVSEPVVRVNNILRGLDAFEVSVVVDDGV